MTGSLSTKKVNEGAEQLTYKETFSVLMQKRVSERQKRTRDNRLSDNHPKLVKKTTVSKENRHEFSAQENQVKESC